MTEKEVGDIMVQASLLYLLEHFGIKGNYYLAIKQVTTAGIYSLSKYSTVIERIVT